MGISKSHQVTALHKIDLHPLDIATMVVFTGMTVGLTMQSEWPVWLVAALYTNCIALALCDFTAFRLPNSLTLSFLLVSTLAAIRFSDLPFEQHIWGAVFGFLIPVLLNLIYRRLRGRDGMGMGDAKLLAGSGMLLGWPMLPAILSIASILGLGYALLKYRAQIVNTAVTRIPFGPFIAFATFLLWLLNYRIS